MNSPIPSLGPPFLQPSAFLRTNNNAKSAAKRAGLSMRSMSRLGFPLFMVEISHLGSTLSVRSPGRADSPLFPLGASSTIRAQ